MGLAKELALLASDDWRSRNLESDRVVRYDPPGTASVYVSQEDPVSGRGIIMRWVKASKRGFE